MRLFAVFLFCLLLASPAPAAPAEVRLSSTIGPIDAGIVPLLAKKFEEKTGAKIAFESAGTGATLKKAQTGEFDMVMVHARKLEDAFVAEGCGVDRRDVMYNDFIILGPPDDPAKIRGLKGAAGARAFMDWLVSPEAQGIIRTFGVEAYGEPLFFPNAKQ